MPARNRTRSTYGWAHVKRVAELKAGMRDGDPCARCGAPMFRADLARIEGDHVGTPRVLGGELPDGLSHRHCNRSHGARLGNRLRGARRRYARQGHAPHLLPGALPQW